MMGLSRDFMQQGGTYMVLSDSSGIGSDELSKVEVAMIGASRIPRLLPLHVKEVDLRVTLWYDITEKKMLSHMLKSEKINMTEYYALLLQVAEALEDSALYMLQPLKYVLDEDYIFVHGSLQEGTLYLTYVPLDRTEGLKPVQDALKELVTRFMASVTELSGSGVQQLLQYTASEDFSPGGFKKLLLGLLSKEGDVRIQAGANNHAPPAARKRDRMQEAPRIEDAGRWEADEPAAINGGTFPWQRPGAVSRMQEKPVSPVRERGLRRDSASLSAARSGLQAEAAMPGEDLLSSKLHPAGRNVDALPDFLKSWNGGDLETEPEAAENVDEAAQKSASARKTYIALGCLLAAAVVWRMIYMPDPGNGTMILCAILTVILGGVATLSWMGKLFAPIYAAADSASFEALPDFGSAELSAEPNLRQGRSRFEIERFTGFLRGGRKNKEEAFVQADKDPEPAWKWKFPPQDAVQDRDGNREMRTRESGAGAVGITGLPHRREGWNRAEDHVPLRFPDTDEGEGDGGIGLKTETLQPGKGAGATVLLSPLPSSGRESHTPVSSPPLGYLLRESDGGGAAERIELRQQHFVIGRSEEVSQYVERSVGTSRAHVELSRSEDGRFLIKDLGSKNGTRLKGEEMVPYKEYPLQDGDTFVIVKGRYTFRSA